MDDVSVVWRKIRSSDRARHGWSRTNIFIRNGRNAYRGTARDVAACPPATAAKFSRPHFLFLVQSRACDRIYVCNRKRNSLGNDVLYCGDSLAERWWDGAKERIPRIDVRVTDRLELSRGVSRSWTADNHRA